MFCTCCVSVCVFLFCKQKTAYERRISDWRSDVCSSDLVGAAPAAKTAPEVAPAEGQAEPAAAEPHPDPPSVAGHKLIERQVLFGNPDKASETGRAACRERVCQYV